MTTIRITIDQSAAILRGSNESGSLNVDLDVSTLTEAQRAMLASLPTDEGRPKVSYCATSAPADIIARLDEHISEATEKRAKIDADNARLAAWYETAAVTSLFRRSSHGYEILGTESLRYALDPYADSACQTPVSRRPEIDAEITRLKALDALAKVEREASEALRAANKQAAIKAGIAALTTWAQAHGSERLAQMRTLGVGDWQAVAEEEFFLAHTPTGYSADQYERSDDTEERKRPTVAELAEYSSLRNLVAENNDVLSEPRLMYHTMSAHDDEDGEHWEPMHYTATDVDITAPTGRTLTVAKIIKAAE